MATFKYKAIDQHGHTTKGQMEALNPADLEFRLTRMGLDLITYRFAKKVNRFLTSKKISQQDLMMFCFQMEQLGSAGVPLLTCLNDLREVTANPHFQKVLGAIFAEVEGGKLLSEALALHPNVFNQVFVSLVHAGEYTGQLPTVFNHLFETIRWQDELMSQTKKLLAYPAFVAFVVMGAVAFLMSYLVPQMVSFLNNMGQDLPWNTVLLIALSETFVNYWWLMLVVIVLLVLTAMLVVNKSEVVRYRLDQLKLNIPMTGNILHKIIMARFARYFALMYQTGIPILQSMHICEQIVGNRVIAAAINRAHVQVSAGDAMSESFQNVGLFPPLVVRMIKIGESTGGLDKSLLNISYFYDRDVNDAMQKMLKLIEPALTVVLGAILAFIMFSVLGPVYDSFSQLKL